MRGLSPRVSNTLAKHDMRLPLRLGLGSGRFRTWSPRRLLGPSAAGARDGPLGLRRGLARLPLQGLDKNLKIEFHL